MLLGVQASPVSREAPEPLMIALRSFHVDFLDVEPFAGDAGGDVGLVLVIGDHDFDRLAEHLAAEILHRHAHGRDRAFAGFMRELTGHVGQHPDLHHIVGYPVGQGGSHPNACSQRHRQRGSTNGTHGPTSLFDPRSAEGGFPPCYYNMHN
jgi:hypothetical protein